MLGHTVFLACIGRNLVEWYKISFLVIAFTLKESIILEGIRYISEVSIGNIISGSGRMKFLKKLNWMVLIKRKCF